MKFNCGPTYAEQEAIHKEWHPFFTIWPRRVGSNDCRAFEWVERRKVYKAIPRMTLYTGYSYEWFYRARP